MKSLTWTAEIYWIDDVNNPERECVRGEGEIVCGTITTLAHHLKANEDKIIRVDLVPSGT